MNLERLDHIVAGALFDFGGYLTTRDERLIASATDNAAPMADAITAFMDLRGVDRNCEPFFQWPARCSLAGDTKVPNRIQAAFEILKSAMQDDPSYAWSWHCNIAVPMQDEGAPHDAANAAAARFMQMCFGVDTSKPPGATGPTELELCLANVEANLTATARVPQPKEDDMTDADSKPAVVGQVERPVRPLVNEAQKDARHD